MTVFLVLLQLALAVVNGAAVVSDPTRWFNAFVAGFCLCGALYTIPRRT